MSESLAGRVAVRKILWLFPLHHKPLSRMLCSQYIPLLVDSYMGIYFSYVYRTVTEHFLDVADIDICFKEAGCEGVAKHMRGNIVVRWRRGWCIYLSYVLLPGRIGLCRFDWQKNDCNFLFQIKFNIFLNIFHMHISFIQKFRYITYIRNIPNTQDSKYLNFIKEF